MLSQEETLYPLSITSYSHLPPVPKNFVSMDLSMQDISHKCNYTLCGFL